MASKFNQPSASYYKSGTPPYGSVFRSNNGGDRPKGFWGRPDSTPSPKDGMGGVFVIPYQAYRNPPVQVGGGEDRRKVVAALNGAIQLGIAREDAVFKSSTVKLFLCDLDNLIRITHDNLSKILEYSPEMGELQFPVEEPKAGKKFSLFCNIGEHLGQTLYHIRLMWRREDEAYKADFEHFRHSKRGVAFNRDEMLAFFRALDSVFWDAIPGPRDTALFLKKATDQAALNLPEIRLDEVDEAVDKLTAAGMFHKMAQERMQYKYDKDHSLALPEGLAFIKASLKTRVLVAALNKAAEAIEKNDNKENIPPNNSEKNEKAEDANESAFFYGDAAKKYRRIRTLSDDDDEDEILKDL